MKQECPLCNEINGVINKDRDESYCKKVKMRQNILYETDNFVVLPDYGAVTVGHALIVSKQHILSFAHMEEEHINELLDIIICIKRYVKLKHGYHVEMFEHGSNSKDESLSMSSITHAHLHIIPVVKKMNIDSLGLKMEETSLYDILKDDDAKNNGYLLFLSSDDKTMCCKCSYITSQFLRKVYAKQFGRADIENWKVKRESSLVHKTIEFYKTLRDTTLVNSITE